MIRSGYRARGPFILRYRHALLAALVSYALVVLALILSGVGVPGAVLLVVLATPAALAGIPLVWLASKEVGRGSTAAIAALASIALPCFMPVVGVPLLNELRRQLRAEAFRANN